MSKPGTEPSRQPSHSPLPERQPSERRDSLPHPIAQPGELKLSLNLPVSRITAYQKMSLWLKYEDHAMFAIAAMRNYYALATQNLEGRLLRLVRDGQWEGGQEVSLSLGADTQATIRLRYPEERLAPFNLIVEKNSVRSIELMASRFGQSPADFLSNALETYTELQTILRDQNDLRVTVGTERRRLGEVKLVESESQSRKSTAP